MKIKLLFILAVCSLNIISCSGEEVTDEILPEVIPDNIKKSDLSDYELDLFVYTEKMKDENGVPINLEIEHEEGDLEWDLRLGKTFDIVIEDWADEKKDPITEIKRLQDLEQIYEFSFIEETAEYVTYSKAIPNDELNITYHFYLVKEVGEGYYYTVMDNFMEKFTLDQIKVMLEAAKSLKPVDNSKFPKS